MSQNTNGGVCKGGFSHSCCLMTIISERMVQKTTYLEWWILYHK